MEQNQRVSADTTRCYQPMVFNLLLFYVATLFSPPAEITESEKF